MGNRDYEGVFLKSKSGDAIDATNRLLISDIIYKRIKFDPSDRKPTYIGLNVSADALDSDLDWEIYKFIYAGNEIVEIIRKTGSWDDRVTLFP